MISTYKPFFISVILALLFWVVDAALDSLFFYEAAFLDLLLFAVPPHEVFIRLSALLFFGGVGLYMSRWLARHHATEFAFRNAQALYTSLVEQLPAGVYRQDLTGRFIYANGWFVSLVGKSPQQVVGATGYDVYPPDVAEAQCESDRAVLTGLNVFSQEESWPDHSGGVRWLWTVKAPVYDALGNVIGMQGILQDITQRRRAVDLLVENEERYRVLFETSTDAIFLESLTGQIVDCNPAAAAIYGYQKSELIGLTIDQLIPQDIQATIPFIIHDTPGASGAFITESIGRRRDGSTFPIEINTQIVRLGSQEYVMAIVRDVTARRHAERSQMDLALEKARVRILSDFIRDATHEFRTPLTVINTQLYLMRSSDDPGKRQAQAAVASQQVGYIEKLLDSLTLMAWLDSGVEMQRAPLNINVLLRELQTAYQGQAAAHGLRLRVALTDPLPDVMANHERLYRALVNLVDNAITYTPPGGAITLRSAYANGRVLISVADTGPGISAEDLPRIFDRFYRGDKARSTRGAGLGLPIARRIIDAHYGSLTVDATPDEGSIFTVDLPPILPPPS